MTHLGYIVAAYVAAAIVLIGMVGVGDARPRATEAPARTARSGGQGPALRGVAMSESTALSGVEATARAAGASGSSFRSSSSWSLVGALLFPPRRRRSVAHPLRASQQAGAGFLAAADRNGGRAFQRRPRAGRPRRQRLGVVVRAVPARASDPDAARRRQALHARRHQLQGRAGERAALPRRARQSVRKDRRRPRREDSGSTGASTACRKPSSSRTASSCTNSSAR